MAFRFRNTFLRARSLSHTILPEIAQNLIWREREREPRILIFGICVFSKMFMFLVLPGEIGLIMDHPFQLFFFVLFGLGNHKSPTIQAHVSRLEMWCVPASLG